MDCSVMVVDDDPKILKLTRMFLEAEGMSVRTALSWVEAAPMLHEGADVALVDVNLGAWRGDELAAILKRSDPALTVLLYSSEDDRSLEAMCRSGGLDGWVSKSTGRRGLVGAIETHATAGRLSRSEGKNTRQAM